MNVNKIRHRILKIFIDNYNEVDSEYGDYDGLSEVYQDMVEMPVATIIKKMGISHREFDMASTKAVQDKAFKLIENRNNEICVYWADNTKLFYNEKIYLQQSKNYFQKPEFVKDIALIGITAIVTTGIGWLAKPLDKNTKEQVGIDKRQDSLIYNLKESVQYLLKKK